MGAVCLTNCTFLDFLGIYLGTYLFLEPFGFWLFTKAIFHHSNALHPRLPFTDLVVITDGMINLPDIQVLESVLSQLRSNAVAVSFLHVGSQFHQDCCPGLVSYSELLQFIANATVGAYISSIQRLVSSLEEYD